MHHSKYDYVKTCIASGMPVRLTSEAGVGKTTMSRQIAEELSLPFYTISCTKQMSVNALIGFISINGTYIPTQFRKAFESGGVFLLDELDAGDPNVLLVLNTIENGYMAFPDGVVEAHPDFRLVATTNPDDGHSIYTGRSKLDFATRDRYHTIHLERDPELELALTSPEVVTEITIARKVLESSASSRQLTMRDAIRIHKLKQLGISDSPIEDVVFCEDSFMYKDFTDELAKLQHKARRESLTQSEAESIDELWEVIQREALDADMSPAETPAEELALDIAIKVIDAYKAKRSMPNYEISTTAVPSGSAFGIREISSGLSRTVTEEEYSSYVPF